MKEQISDWLDANGVSTPREVVGNNDFITFLGGLYPSFDGNIEEKVNQLSLTYDDIDNFSGGLDKALSN